MQDIEMVIVSGKFIKLTFVVFFKDQTATLTNKTHFDKPGLDLLSSLSLSLSSTFSIFLSKK